MFSECLRKGALITETELVGDFGNARGSVKESVAGGLDTSLG